MMAEDTPRRSTAVAMAPAETWAGTGGLPGRRPIRDASGEPSQFRCDLARGAGEEPSLSTEQASLAQPAGLIEPASLEEALQLLTAAWRGGQRTVVRGSIGSEDERPARLLSLRRLNRIRSVDRENGALVAEAGASIESLRSAAAALGLWCPALRWLPAAGSVGAAIAGGHGRRARHYGAVGDYVLGARFACPSVGLVQHGGLAMKNATGYNLSGLLVGSRGALGVILEAILRLVPLPACRVCRALHYPTPARALAAARELADPALGAAAVEVACCPGHGLSRVLLEVDDAAATSAEGRLAALLARGVNLGGEAVESQEWPPLPVPAGAATRRVAIDPARFAEVGSRLLAEARRRGLGVTILAEATGGAMEVAVEEGDPAIVAGLALAAGVSLPDRAIAQVASSLKSAFDPDAQLLST